MDQDTKTERQIERNKEDQKYDHVIIKRNDQTRRHPDDVLETAIEDGLEQYKKNKRSLLLSSITAGLIMSLTVLCICFASELASSDNSLTILYQALFYPLAFIITVLSGTQLFTEQTATAVYPVLEKKIKYISLIKLLSIVLAGNFIGTFLGSLGLIIINPGEGLLLEHLPVIAHHLLGANTYKLILSSVFAGFLMAQGGWLTISMFSSMGQIISIFIVTFIIGIGGFYHSIAGSAELFSYLLFTHNYSEIGSILYFLSFCVLGNIIGGSVFVGFLNFAHIRKTN